MTSDTVPLPVLRPDQIEVNLATEAHGNALAALAALNGFEWDGFELDWSSCPGSWLIAHDESGSILGAIQVLPGRPIGQLDRLFVDPRLAQIQIAAVVHRLIGAGLHALHATGSQAVASVVTEEHPDYIEYLGDQWGAVTINRGRTMFVGVTAAKVEEDGRA